ncbi:MAG: acylphosphatase [Pseudonocardia sp.]
MSTNRGSAVRLNALVGGYVQGVGFRWWTRSQARSLGLVGSVANLPDGRVEVIAEGPRADCERLLAALRSRRAPGRVGAVEVRWEPATGGLHSFAVR